MNFGQQMQEQGHKLSKCAQHHSTSSKMQQKYSDPGYCKYFYIAVGLILLFVLSYTVIEETQRTNKVSAQFLQASLAKQKRSIMDDMKKKVEISFEQIIFATESSISQVKQVIEEQSRDLDDISERMREQNEENKIAASFSNAQSQIESTLQEQKQEMARRKNIMLSHFQRIQNKLQKARRKQWVKNAKEKALYSDDQLKAKKQYQSKLLVFLKGKKDGYDQILEKHKYNFELKDDPKDPQPHYHINIKTQYVSSMTDLPICVVIPDYLPLSKYAIQHSLNSIFHQDYLNYNAIIFGSPKKEINTFVLSYLNFNNISESHYRYVQSSENGSSLENIHNAIHNYCHPNSAAIILEGGNALLTKEAFKSINNMHRQGVYGLIITNHLKINPDINFADWGAAYLPNNNEVSTKGYRQRLNYQLFTFKVEVFKEIKLEDFKDSNGKFFSSYVFAIIKPLLELSCEMTRKFNGLYMIEYVNQEISKNIQVEKAIFDILKERKAYGCSQHLMSQKKKM